MTRDVLFTRAFELIRQQATHCGCRCCEINGAHAVIILRREWDTLEELRDVRDETEARSCQCCATRHQIALRAILAYERELSIRAVRAADRADELATEHCSAGTLLKKHGHD